MRWVLRSKIHKATVTDANVAYVGSITIDEELIERVGLWPVSYTHLDVYKRQVIIH